MIKKSWALFFVFVFVLSVVSASDINVRTYPGYKVSIFVLSPGEVYNLLDSSHKMSDANGISTMTYTGAATDVNIIVKVTLEGQTIIQHKFEGVSLSNNVYLQVLPDLILNDYKKFDEDVAAAKSVVSNDSVKKEEVVNSSPVEVKETKKIDNTGVNTVSGFAVNESISNISNKTYYILFGVLLVGVIAFVFYKKRDPAYNYRALSPSDIDKELKRAEEKLADAQSQINALKNKDKIVNMQNKIQQEQSNLDKLLKGE